MNYLEKIVKLVEPVILKLILTKRVGQRVSDDGNEIIKWSLTKKYYKLVFVSLMKSLIVSKLSFYSSDVKESWSQISRTHIITQDYYKSHHLNLR